MAECVADDATPAEVERVFRADYGRVVAAMTRMLGDVGLAEEAVQEAFAAALESWPRSGIPPSTTGWIVTTARNRAIDRFRRETTRDQRHADAELVFGYDDPLEDDDIQDDRLRLIFTCCHPALSSAAQVALTLKLVAGLTTAEIAGAFLVSEVTMAQRIVRAKNKIGNAHIPYRVPEVHEFPNRLAPVLSVVYLVFNEGYLASAGGALTRVDLAREGVRLGRVLMALMPDEPEVQGLLALMLLTESRRPARVDLNGELVLLADQDRTLWDPVLVEEGQSLVRACLRRNTPGAFQVQAAIAAVHSDAHSARDTDWSQIVELYDRLLLLAPSPVVRLNRAIAVAELHGPKDGLRELADLSLDNYHRLHSTRAELLTRLGRLREADDEYGRAIELTENEVERRFLVARQSLLR